MGWERGCVGGGVAGVMGGGLKQCFQNWNYFIGKKSYQQRTKTAITIREIKL